MSLTDTEVRKAKPTEKAYFHDRGYLHEHIELQLAHAPRNSVSAAYNHALYLQPRAKMMQD